MRDDRGAGQDQHVNVTNGHLDVFYFSICQRYMYSVLKYLLGGLVALMSLIALYKATQFAASIIQGVFPQFNASLLTFVIFFFILVLFGYAVIKNWALVSLTIKIIMNLKRFSARTRNALNNPVYFEVSPGIQKIGFITNEDITSIDGLGGKIAVFAPNPMSFSGEVFIVERKTLHIIEEKDKKRISTILFTAGIFDELA